MQKSKEVAIAKEYGIRKNDDSLKKNKFEYQKMENKKGN